MLQSRLCFQFLTLNFEIKKNCKSVFSVFFGEDSKKKKNRKCIPNTDQNILCCDGLFLSSGEKKIFKNSGHFCLILRMFYKSSNLGLCIFLLWDSSSKC